MSASPPAASAGRWALLFGNFAIGCGVMVVAGSLNDLTRSLQVSVAAAGQLITVAALMMALGTPLLAALVGGFARAKLESILHPLIRAESSRRLAAAAAPYAVLAVPLLFESGAWADRVDRIVAVDCDEALQVARAAARPGLDESAVRSVMAAQWPRWRRLQMADEVVWNGGSLEALDRACEALHGRLMAAARARPSRP